MLPGLTAGVGVVQVARGAAELHGVEEAVAPARVKRLGRPRRWRQVVPPAVALMPRRR